MISARARGASTVPVPLMVPGVQDPHDPDRLDHLLGAHGYLAAPSSPGRAAAELEVPAPFGPNWPGLAVAAKAEYGSRCPAGRSAGIVRPPDQGRTLPRASNGFLVQSPLGHTSPEIQ